MVCSCLGLDRERATVEMAQMGNLSRTLERGFVVGIHDRRTLGWALAGLYG